MRRVHFGGISTAYKQATWRSGGEAAQEGTVGHRSHDPYFHVFLMEAGVMTFVAHCT